ncbi:hypothetical protein MTP99_017761 [Tenebrio molitor]|nr:hypothetical protein MTP99_017761 [Tenebrio molitor]
MPLQASNVKMYETHNPGFCYKRNGEHRLQQILEVPPPVDFEHLHFLLFTDGEVDIEKVLCLHLLSSHETDHLTPPRRPRTTTSMKKDSPLEQLIERSKENPKEAVLAAVLPTYVLDVNKGNPKRTLIDERLSARLLVNEKILELIMTVITALEHSNPEKVRHLISIADDPSSLKRIFRKQHIQDFVMTLKDHSLVNSCSSFILTQPSKLKPNHIEIRTASGALEDLVRFIRSNVLQFPNRSSFNILEVESRELVSIQHTPLLSKSSQASSRTSGSTTRPESRKDSSSNESTPRFRRNSINFVEKNIASIPKYKKSTEEESPQPRPKRVRRSSVDSARGSKTSSRTSTDIGKKNVGTKQEQAKNKQNEELVKVHLKQTTCPACMEKWKIPLPTPKVCKVAKITVESGGSSERVITNPVIKTNSMHRISMLIEREQYKLDTYDRKYTNASNTSNLSQNKKRGSVQRSSLDLVALNVLDLEKIRQEIREKETKKKLEKFLGD